MDLREERYQVVEWIYIAQMGSKWRVVMDTIINYTA